MSAEKAHRNISLDTSFSREESWLDGPIEFPQLTLHE